MLRQEAIIEFKPATRGQLGVLLRLLREQASDYLQDTLKHLGIGWSDFSQLFRTVGLVVGIYMDDQLAGFYWIEERKSTLHLHSLVLSESFQGRGIGTQVMQELEGRSMDHVDAIELGVHESNRRAKRLYEGMGFQTIRKLDDLGFVVLQKKLSRAA